MKNKKHNHTLTNLLKVFVFSLMILMPFIIFIPNAFYYGFNETAVAQEKTEQVPVYYESNEVTQPNDIIVGKVYYYSDNFISDYRGNNIFLFSIDANFYYSQFPSETHIESPFINLYISGSNGRAFLWNTGMNTVYIDALPMYFLVYSVNDYNNLSYIYEKISIANKKFIKEYQPLVTNMSITDSMSYAWKSTWQNELFSWTGNTAIYTGINTTTSGIGISENSYIANYLAYIFLLTIIYVIVDIIIGAFTMLTHLFNKEPK